MTYHLSRIANWIQNKNVNYYLTYIDRQLKYPPLSEYIIMHIILLLNSDIAVNVVQSIAYIINTILLYQIFKKLNVSKHFRYMGILLFISMPIAVAESITTQTDLMGCIWILCLLNIVLDIRIEKKLSYKNKRNIIQIITCAATCAFGYLTKSNSCLAMFPIVIYLLIIRFKKDNIKDLLVLIFLAGSVITLLVISTFISNYEYFGDVFASKNMTDVIIGTLNPKYVFMNFYKNYALICSNSFTHHKLENLGVKISYLLNINIDDLRITYSEGCKFANNLPYSYHCDVASASIIGIIFAISIIIYIFIYKNIKKENSFLITLILAIFIPLLFTKYQTWGDRLFLSSSLPIMCIFIIIIINHLYERYTKNDVFDLILGFICILCIFDLSSSIKYQLNTYYWPNIKCDDSYDMYFIHNNVNDQYKSICEYILNNNINEIGLYNPNQSYEYPLWIKLKNKDTNIYQIIIENQQKGIVPECIIALNCNLSDNYTLLYNYITYSIAYSYDKSNNYAVLLPTSIK